MSAQAYLAGLFPPTTEKWHEDIMWQPVPVHMFPKELDILLHGDRPCPKYEILLKEYLETSEEAREVTERYGHHFSYWEEKSKTEVKDVAGVAYLYKKLVTEKEDGRV